jgi:transcription elongation factor Elf1
MKTKNEIVEQVIKDYEKEFNCRLFGQEPLLERAVKATEKRVYEDVLDYVIFEINRRFEVLDEFQTSKCVLDLKNNIMKITCQPEEIMPEFHRFIAGITSLLELKKWLEQKLEMKK